MGPERGLEERVAELEARLAALEDERELRELLAQYSFGADLYRGKPWVDLWTEDGVYALGEENRPGAYSGDFAGADRLLELITGDAMPPAGRSQHHVHGPVRFWIDGDAATAEGYSVTFVRAEGSTQVWTIGFSRWSFRRVDGRWRIHRRERRELGAPDPDGVISPPAG